MQRIAKPEVVKVTPAEAQKMLDSWAHFAGQRNMRENLEAHYENEIKKGEFFCPTVMVVKQAFNGGQSVLVNGHHTLNAIVRANRAIYVTIEKWEVNSPEELGSMYGKHDTKGFRTQGDIVKAHVNANHWDLPVWICSAVVSAASVKEGVERQYKDEKVKLLAKYIDAAVFFNDILEATVPDGVSKAISKHMRRKPVYAAMLYTWEKNRSDAKRFWVDVRDGESLKRTSPALLLRDFLKDHTYNFARGSQSLGAVTMHEMLSKCIVAWNAFRDGRPLKFLKYYPGKPIPKPV